MDNRHISHWIQTFLSENGWLNQVLHTETCKKYLVTVSFYYIFYIKPHFLKTLFQSRLLFDFDDFVSIIL
jgi:hypothetical protein